MGKKRYTPYQHTKGLNKFDFSDLVGISGTLGDEHILHDESVSGGFKPPEGNPIPVNPVFKEEKSEGGFVKWSQIKLVYKIGAGVGTFLIAVVTPAIWWASKVDTGVTDLKTDVKEIKSKIEKLTECAITNSSKIENMEKSGKSKR